MGAWGPGSFENDTALDFVGEITDLNSLMEPLSAELEEAEIDADLSCQIIVSAECVAALQGHAARELPDDLAAKLASMGKPQPELIDAVRDNVSAVMSRSELCELWADEGSGDWNRAMTDLMERLNAPAKAANLKKAGRKKKANFNNSLCSFCNEPMGEESFSMFDITVHEDDISAMKQGGFAHLKCLNAALHPSHMVQHWEFDDETLARLMDSVRADD